MVILHIKLKEKEQRAPWGQKSCHVQTLYTPVWSQKVKFSTFLKQIYVAYQIEGIDKCSNMVVNILPTDTLSTAGGGVKRFFFSESSYVAYQTNKNVA